MLTMILMYIRFDFRCSGGLKNQWFSDLNISWGHSKSASFRCVLNINGRTLKNWESQLNVSIKFLNCKFFTLFFHFSQWLKLKKSALCARPTLLMDIKDVEKNPRTKFEQIYNLEDICQANHVWNSVFQWDCHTFLLVNCP